jgi:hypothetical protein
VEANSADFQAVALRAAGLVPSYGSRRCAVIRAKAGGRIKSLKRCLASIPGTRQ